MTFARVPLSLDRYLHARIRIGIILVLLISVNLFATMGSATSSCFDTQAVGSAPVIHRFAGNKELGSDLAKRIEQLSRKAINEKGEFTIAFSGGSLPGIVAPGLLEMKDSIEWSKWKVYFADERHVPHDSPDSNYKAVKEGILDKLPLQPKVFTINHVVSVEEAAAQYESQLPQARFDLVLLGMGPDGHTASLFPGHALLTEKTRKIAFIKDSPKPPPERITFTLPYLNDARNVFFVTSGASKAEVVARCAIDRSKLEATPLPSALVRPTKGSLEWYVDNEAAAKL